MTQRGATILHGLPLLSFMCLLLSTRRLRSLRHIIRAIAFLHAPGGGERRRLTFLSPPFLPLLFSTFFPSFPSPCTPPCTPPCSSPFSPTLLPSFLFHLAPFSLLPSPCSSNRPTSASSSWPVSRRCIPPATARPTPTQTLDRYGLQHLLAADSTSARK